MLCHKLNNVLDVLIGVTIFTIGFFLGVWERKVDKLTFKPHALPFISSFSPRSEILKTPSPEEMQANRESEWQRKMSETYNFTAPT